MDAAFYMAKELLMTERTYKKDLQVIAVVSVNDIAAILLVLAFCPDLFLKEVLCKLLS